MSPTTRLTLLFLAAITGMAVADDESYKPVPYFGMLTYDRSRFNDDPAKLRAHNLKCFGGPTR
jgi:hypothetical protein